jgi:hypothetical protein
MAANEEWFTPTVRYDTQLGYVMLQLPRPALPPTLTFDGVTFEAKAELHVSLLTTVKLAEYFTGAKQAQSRLATHVKAFLQQRTIMFEGFLPELYHCKHKDVQTIVVGAKLQGIAELFSSLRRTFAELQNLPEPAVHVTLYTYNSVFGIGIQNASELQRLCTLIPRHELTDLRQCIV